MPVSTLATLDALLFDDEMPLDASDSDINDDSDLGTSSSNQPSNGDTRDVAGSSGERRRADSAERAAAGVLSDLDATNRRKCVILSHLLC
jgi:hypothetical protein